MTKEELDIREAALASAGYRKSRSTSQSNDYSWFKTVRLRGEEINSITLKRKIFSEEQ